MEEIFCQLTTKMVMVFVNVLINQTVRRAVKHLVTQLGADLVFITHTFPSERIDRSKHRKLLNYVENNKTKIKFFTFN